MWFAGLARCVPDPLPRFGDRRRTRVGLLGGSFNPAHAGHRHVAELALARLGLDQVWLMVSPGQSSEAAQGMAPLAERLSGAAAIGDGRRVIATSIETRIRHPIFRRHAPSAAPALSASAICLDHGCRPADTTAALAALAGNCQRFAVHRGAATRLHAACTRRPGSTPLAHGRRPAHEAPVLSRARSGWVFLQAPENATSATAIREAVRETKEPYHSRHAQTAIFTGPPSTPTAEARP